MAPGIPDCGIFSTPRREPRLRVLAEGLDQPPNHSPSTPSLSTLSLTSPKDALKASEIPTTSGMSLSFYKSPAIRNITHKPVKTPTHGRSARMTGGRKKRGGDINRGVGHGIKKPKLKLIEEKKKKQKVEEAVKRIKAKEPCIPANRVPVQSPPVQQKMSGESFLPSSGRFFTSRSRAAATVQISKNIRLSAKYGDMSLNQKSRGFAKKNIGRQLEEKLDQYLQKSRLTKGIDEALPLPSVPNTPRPAPTRIPSSPSPTKKVTNPRKRSPSPRKRIPQARKRSPSPRKSAASHKLNTSGGEELQDMESIMKEWDDDDKAVTASSDGNTPRRHRGLSTPSRRSPRKMSSECASPVRKSPRKMMNGCASPLRKSPRKMISSICASPVRKSPRKQITTPHTPTRRSSQHQEETDSPRRRRSPRKIDVSVPKTGVKEGEEVASEAPPKDVKYFPIFNPKTRLSDCKFMKSKTVKGGKRTSLDKDNTQMMIDAGQKEFGVWQCPSCGFMLEVANASDDATHTEYHNYIFTALKHNGWKKENLVREYDHYGGRVLVVSGEDPPHWWQKVEEVREVVDNELGFSENSIKIRENTKVFMYVLERQVVGCLIAEKIDKAFRVMPQKQQKEESGQLVCCSQVPTKVWVGVSRVWVLQAHRGKGIATILVDVMRHNMIKNHILSIDQFAFSDPTEVGMSFAEKYTGKKDFLVYRREF